MSFQFTVAIAREERGDAAAKVFAAYDGSPNGHSPRRYQEQNGTGPEAEDLVSAAAAAAGAAVLQLGDAWATAIINVSGHANPGHAARPGWANDFVAVRVILASYAGSAPEA